LLAAMYPSERGAFALTLVDVGSMGGLEDEWTGLAPNLRVVGFEPDRREFERLRQTVTTRHLPSVVLDRSRDVTLYVSRDPGKSSVLRPNLDLLRRFPNSERFEVVSEQRFSAEDVATLDDALAGAAVDEVDFLKLDTQGSEHLVLQGAAQTLLLVVAAKVEVEFLELYERQPLFADVDALMRASGFTLVDLDRVFWKRSVYPDHEGKGQLVFADALYFRDPEALLESSACEEHVFAKTFRFVVVAVIYGLHDLAAAAIEGYTKRGLRGCGSLEALLGQIRDWDVSQGAWARRDGTLGNRPNRS
jgi:FkbM family methyltransferase